VVGLHPAPAFPVPRGLCCPSKRPLTLRAAASTRLGSGQQMVRSDRDQLTAWGRRVEAEGDVRGASCPGKIRYCLVKKRFVQPHCSALQNSSVKSSVDYYIHITDEETKMEEVQVTYSLRKHLG